MMYKLVFIFFFNLVKVNEVWVKTKSKWTKIWNGESRKHAYDNTHDYDINIDDHDYDLLPRGATEDFFYNTIEDLLRRKYSNRN